MIPDDLYAKLQHAGHDLVEAKAKHRITAEQIIALTNDVRDAFAIHREDYTDAAAAAQLLSIIERRVIGIADICKGDVESLS